LFNNRNRSQVGDWFFFLALFGLKSAPVAFVPEAENPL
jgi:hypothetical protein